MKKVKILSVCSGAGGSELSLNKDRYEIIAHSENNLHASQVLNFHYPDIHNFGDIRNITKNNIKKFDLLIGGTPCQNLSYQGNRKGLSGSKSSLFYEYHRLLVECKPNYFLWENVKGALTSNNGEDFKIILHMFKEAGYEIQYRIFNAKDFGTIQARERIFIFGVKKGAEKKHIKELDSVVYGGKEFKEIKKGKIIAASKSTRRKHYDYRIRTDDLVNTLTTGIGCTGQSTWNYILDESGLLRYLTPIECEQLMCWPKNWTKYSRKASGEIFETSERERYRMIGNGIVPTIVSEILDQIILGNYGR